MSELFSTLLAVGAILLGGVLVLVGVVFLWGAFASVGVARASAGWPSAAGRVVKSEIRDNRQANGLPGHRTLVRYEYVVDGEVYEGRDLASGEFPYRSAASARRRLAAYPVGAAVTVRYCTDEPQLSVVEPGVSFDVLYLPVVASLLSLGALALVAWGGGRLLHIIAG